MKKWKQLLAAFALIIAVSAVVVPTGTASAINVFDKCGSGGKGGGSTEVCGAAQNDNATSMAKVIINTLLYILGIIAVIMIVIGGIKYTASNGEASRVKSAKDTIMYSVVGLIVAIFAYAIVNFVVTRF
ncbi:MAG: hypothetical protein JWO55_285 [Candidatus Saccharibacteria bacterium]|jgi:hypothetical protein|nr:hypothetical protein [Candidatus Saccharibacteria bacterium]